MHDVGLVVVVIDIKRRTRKSICVNIITEITDGVCNYCNKGDAPVRKRLVLSQLCAHSCCGPDHDIILQ